MTCPGAGRRPIPRDSATPGCSSTKPESSSERLRQPGAVIMQEISATMATDATYRSPVQSGPSNHPSRVACNAASTRLRTPIFRKISWMWDLTVLSLR
ncbi:MAG: hypothetical protein QOI51_1210 [Nocardioidaceae bacterium]|jgi:hypothetical protein|nr:hypothetical protein [Nocardioidaceae bacterium]